jgi:hypothetical protein
MKFMTLFLVLGSLIFSTSAYSGKQKSEEDYLQQIDATIAPIAQSLARLKEILDSNNDVGSFLTADFWGLKPGWYLTTDTTIMLTNQYVYADKIMNHYGVWEKFPEHANRNINGVILSPVRADRDLIKILGDPLIVNLSFDVDTSPGFDGPFDNRFIHWLKNDLERAGVPQNKMNDALDYFDSKFSKCLFKYEKSVLTKFDNLFSGNSRNGSYRDYDKILYAVDKYYTKNNQLPPGVTPEQISIPAQHPQLFTENNFVDAGNPTVAVRSFRDFYTSTIDEREAERLKKITLLEFYLKTRMLNIDLSAGVQCFKIANGKDKSIRYNQIKMIQQMLEEKVATGRAIKINKKGKFVVYQDSTGNGLYKGELGIDFDSGIGYWQMPIRGAKAELDEMHTTLKSQVGKLNIFISEYFTLCKKYTIAKFRTNSSTSTVGKQSDF